MYLEKYNLDGRIAVVTGGGRGIGLEICRALGEAGATLVIADVIEESAVAAADALANEGIGAEARALDVTDAAAVTAAAADIHARHGQVDILVNNAGMARNTDAIATTDEEWRAVMDVNLNGVFHCARAFGNYMVEHGSGSVVNLGSMSGIIANKPQPQAAYNASKAAVHLLTKSLACEWASNNVRVNALAPGYVATEMTRPGREKEEWNSMWLEMTPMKRCAAPDEIASAALFLASDASSFITGSVLVVDGGYTAW
jgi:NAD(P)-dependent dehydrogenase (short-subunit alcohol dehydrogenase family)